MASIVVSGYMLRHPLAGAAGSCLQYLLDLAMLGHDVLYVEGSDWPHSCPGVPAASPSDELPLASLTRVRETLRAKRIEASVVWVDARAGLVEGMVWPQLRRRVARADVLLDVGGACLLDERASARCRALVDIDRRLARTEGFPLADYDVRYSYATNPVSLHCGIGAEDARVVLERLLEEISPRELRAAA
jgi:hypothetical protein